MTIKISVTSRIFAALAVCCSLPVAASSPESNTQYHKDLHEAARQEGELVVYSVTSSVPLLLEDFQRLYPGIKLRYVTMDTSPLHERIISEAEDGSVADIAWSSAMDLQVELVDGGYAMSYESPELTKIPPWAVWRNQAFGTSFEPVGIVYNKSLLAASEVPQSRTEFIELITSAPQRFHGKIIAFDPVASGLGYLLMTQDAAKSGDEFWSLAQTMACAGLRPQSGSGAMFKLIASGDALVGYNLLGSYTQRRASTDLPELGLVLPNDYTLIMSRVMFILRDAPHPNAAKLWLDYVLSKRGQQMISESGLGSVRSDVVGEFTSTSFEQNGGKVIKPITIDAELLTHLDADMRRTFLHRWQRISSNHCSAELTPN